MALEWITGSLWDADHSPIPAENEPELWFRPLASSMKAGLVTDREIPAEEFDVDSGVFGVHLESSGALRYVPIVRWLKNPEDPNNRSRGQAEWAPFYPGTGGPIDQLPGVPLSPDDVWVGLEDNPPPAGFKGWWLVSGPGDPATTGSGDLRRVY